jgi:hypothetical protein
MYAFAVTVSVMDEGRRMKATRAIFMCLSSAALKVSSSCVSTAGAFL